MQLPQVGIDELNKVRACQRLNRIIPHPLLVASRRTPLIRRKFMQERGRRTRPLLAYLSSDSSRGRQSCRKNTMYLVLSKAPKRSRRI